MRLITSVLTLIGFSVIARAADPGSKIDWKQLLQERLPLYGHRNWIVVADSAYPAQARDGIETVVSGEDQLTVLRYVLGAVAKTRHVRPIVLLDRELQSVPEADAHGVQAYRRELGGVLNGDEPQVLPHEQIISKLDSAAQTFRVLIIKTNLAIPYTSVFLQLDCAYWSAEQEQRLRRQIAAEESRQGH